MAIEFKNLSDQRKGRHVVHIPVPREKLIETTERMADLTLEIEELEERKAEIPGKIKILQKHLSEAAKLWRERTEEQDMLGTWGFDWNDKEGEEFTLGKKYFLTTQGQVHGPFPIAEADMQTPLPETAEIKNFKPAAVPGDAERPTDLEPEHGSAPVGVLMDNETVNEEGAIVITEQTGVTEEEIPLIPAAPPKRGRGRPRKVTPEEERKAQIAAGKSMPDIPAEPPTPEPPPVYPLHESLCAKCGKESDEVYVTGEGEICSDCFEKSRAARGGGGYLGRDAKQAPIGDHLTPEEPLSAPAPLPSPDESSVVQACKDCNAPTLAKDLQGYNRLYCFACRQFRCDDCNALLGSEADICEACAQKEAPVG